MLRSSYVVLLGRGSDRSPWSAQWSHICFVYGLMIKSRTSVMNSYHQTKPPSPVPLSKKIFSLMIYGPSVKSIRTKLCIILRLLLSRLMAREFSGEIIFIQKSTWDMFFFCLFVLLCVDHQNVKLSEGHEFQLLPSHTGKRLISALVLGIII